ncbi:hypothetical protein ACSBR1_004893 [Camellia fascicularis]
MAYASSSSMSTVVFNLPRTRRSSPIQTTRVWPSRFRCSAGQPGFFTKLGRLIKEKAKSDVDKLFSGFSKTRDNLAVIDELEEALLVADFGPKVTIKIVESLWDDIYAGKLKSGSEIKGTKVLGAEVQSQPQPSAHRELYPCMVDIQNNIEKW